MLSALRPLLLHLKTLFLDQEGQDLVEYALVVALLSAAAVAAEENVATSIAVGYQHIEAAFNAAV